MLDAQRFIGVPKILVSKLEDNVSRFELNYLPRGLGYTLGNALRRIVLSYNMGGAVTGLKIKGVPHEYYTIEGVKENVINIMLNFKKLRFNIDESVESIQRHTQNFKGLGIYDSSKLKLPAGVEVLNDKEYLFEITNPSQELSIDMRIEKGYKYYSVDYLRTRDKESESSDINILLIDNEFRLVKGIDYEVKEVIDDFTGATKDSLIIDIQTLFNNVSAKEIMMFAGEVLALYAKLFAFDNVFIDRSAFVEYEDLEEEAAEIIEEAPIKTMPIDALPLSERTRNALIKNDILYIEDLEKKKKSELLSMKGVGKKAIDEINKSLANIKRSLTDG